jgi:hypothetical protein
MIDLNMLSKAMEIENPFIITLCKLVKNAENKLILKVNIPAPAPKTFSI